MALAIGAEDLSGGAIGKTFAIARGLAVRAGRLRPRLTALKQSEHASEGATGRDLEDRPPGDLSGEASCPIVEPCIVQPGPLSPNDAVVWFWPHSTERPCGLSDAGLGEPEEGP